jgi:hypothetical protein
VKRALWPEERHCHALGEVSVQAPRSVILGAAMSDKPGNGHTEINFMMPFT